ncbi:MAG TPA: urease accessory protein UreD [Steroidobacteraceae bacterium]|nr:urease accessory protein UreD [Steroidobacteraceae bacterium]
MAAKTQHMLGERGGWLASLDLEFATRGTCTVLTRRAHIGPLVVQRPFYPEGGVCHVYLVHPPGGVVGGDTLELHARVRDGAHALITTPAATKFYRSEGRIARQLQDLALDAAICEWLPQETILFPDAHASIATRVRLGERSKFIGWEIVCYGRPASGLLYTSGRAHQDFELWLNDVPIVLDHLRLDGASDTMQGRFALAGHTALGTMFAYPATDALLETARTVSHRCAHIACTKVDGVLVCRAVGSQAGALREAFARIWSLIRPHIAGRAAAAPRIWST